jgi:glutamate--cysteine ligase
MKQSAPIGDAEQAALDQNHVTVARRGREPGLTLWREGRTVSMQAWAQELLDSMSGISEVLDRGDPSRPYSQALAVQSAKLANAALTPSARLMEELSTTDESFFDLALRMSKTHKGYFLDLYPPNQERLAEFAAQVQESLAKQVSIEAGDQGTYEQYLQRYFAN